MGPTFIAYGTPEQQARYLPPMLAGESTWCIGMSEPDSGSDLASLSTRAVRDGDEWVIDGRKIWTSFADRADHCYLICRTDSVPGRPHLGISEIVVPMDTPGIEVRPIRDLTGAEHFNEVWFDGVRVPVGNLVGVEGAAFAQTMRQLEHERGGIDRLVSNRALLRWALERADTDDPLVRQEVARLETGYRLGRLMVVRGVLGQAPGRLQRRHQVPVHRVRAGASPTSWRASPARRRCCGATSASGSPTPPPTRSWGAPRT